MHAPSRATLLLSGILTMAGAAAAPAVHAAQTTQAAPTVTFTVVDNADPTEVEEATTVFINGHLVATFVLNADHQTDEKRIIVPQALVYDYALCGRVTVRGPDGKNVTHVLDDGATLRDVDGRRFEALAGADFTVFYLAERVMMFGPNSEATYPNAPGDIHRTHVCDIPMS
jgi:hypothetical protein